MYFVTQRTVLCANVLRLTVMAPQIAKAAQPGQFVIVQTGPGAQRMPIPISDWDASGGTVSIIFPSASAGTVALSEKHPGDSLQDFIGPLGRPCQLDGIQKAAVIGGGLDCAAAYPIAKSLHGTGCEVHSILGFHSRERMLLREEFEAVSHRLAIVTDDGSYGEKASVTTPLKQLLEAGEVYDRVFAIGPLTMMKFVSLTTTPYHIPTVVSVDPIAAATESAAAASAAPTDAPRVSLPSGPPAAPSQRQKMHLFP